MSAKKHYRIFSVVLVVLIVSTALIGYSNAAVEEPKAPNVSSYNFWLLCQAEGVTDLATARLKESTLSYARYQLTTVYNYSGYSGYINVRTADGSTIAGIAQSVYGIGSINVSYLSGYGLVGYKYRPSGQTNSNSVGQLYIEGNWIP